MLLKLAALIYRTTGYYSFYAEFKEHEYISKKMPRLFSRYVTDIMHEDEMSFQDFVDIQRGLWQARHGFYRRLR